MMYPKQKAWHNKKYLEHVRQYPCVVCGYPETIPHHIRFASNSGTGMKPSDTWCIPLCKNDHDEIHRVGFFTFQKQYEVDIWRELFMMVKAWVEKSS